MSIANLSNVLKIFGGSDISPEEESTLFREVLLMTLSRASSSDSNTHPVEVETVQKIIEKATGEEISTADIRVAAASELYEKAPLEKYLSTCGQKLNSTSRAVTVKALAMVIKSDTQVTSREIDFFNMVAAALAVTPAEIAGLVAD
ncbi:MAG: TerB family tellurite resistance protein [Candidatus Rariloculaceae bacterium]